MSPRQLNPLVPASAQLTSEQLGRFSRHIILPAFGLEAQRRLVSARVAVIGAGGLGSPILLYLAAAGVGTLGIIDDDTVETSNLQRQVVHGDGDVGRLKAESARDAILARNPEAHVVLHPQRMSADNALQILSGYDLVIDGSDNFATRYLTSDAAEVLGIPCVWGSILRFDGQVSTFWGAPNDGLPGVTYRDLFPTAPDPASVPSCAEGGVLGMLCGTIGTAMATEAVKLITGVGVTLLGRVLHHDALTATWREFTLTRDPQRATIVALTVEEASPAAPTPDTTPIGSEWTPEQLARAMDAPSSTVVLVDIREPDERSIAAIHPSLHLPLGDFYTGDATLRLPRDTPVVLYCHHGVRSARLLSDLMQAGFQNVHHLAGGIDSWAHSVDSTMPRY